MASERITWETCSHCGRTAAVGWLDGVPVEFDCTHGCPSTDQDLTLLQRSVGGTSTVTRWKAAAWR